MVGFPLVLLKQSINLVLSQFGPSTMPKFVPSDRVDARPRGRGGPAGVWPGHRMQFIKAVEL